MHQGGFTLYRCPFCNENTLVTNKQEDSFSCFSCGRTGKISEERKTVEKEEIQEDKTFLDIYEKSAIFYYLKLREYQEATDYLKKRNIKEAKEC